jgi:hypothetical protein
MAKGRQAKHVEFIRLLAELFGYDSRGDYAPFAKRLGKSS